MDKNLLTQNGKAIVNPHLDPSTTLACMEGVLAAYDLYNQSHYDAPSGFSTVSKFTGWDRYFHFFAQEEDFGIVFRSNSDPATLLIAIRGTSSLLDAYEDLWAIKASFRPLNSQGFPNDVGVASGFNSVYTETGGSMTASMQQQIQSIIVDRVGISNVKKVIVTGHSLGSALCSLLALDLAVSLPQLEVYNYNFASPRVGGEAWKHTYEDRYSLGKKTFRISNYYDWVPSLPFEFMGYEHVGMNFLVSFYVKNAIIPKLVARHSMKNHQVVIEKGLYQSPQHWYGDFTDRSEPDSSRVMVSVAPPALEVPNWAETFGTFQKDSIEMVGG